MTDLIQKFLASHFGGADFTYYQLAGDASNRRYYRVVKDQTSLVLMAWEAFNPKDYPFLSVHSLFQKCGVQVPEVLSMDASAGLVLLEDLGDLTLERRFWESQNQDASLPFYKKAIDELLKIHFATDTFKNSECTAFKVQFDTDKLLWELNYGKANLLEGLCGLKFTEQQAAELQKVFVSICERLHAEPKWVAHRDYHSRNLMIKLDQVRVIDFQDARRGPLQYDLVSLLRDSYVQLSERICDELVDHYLVGAKPYLPAGFSRERFELIYELQSVQRCFKACGSFSSFYVQRSDTRYLKYIAGTLRRVLKSLTFFPEYRFFSDLLIDCGALERKYENP